MLKRYAIRLTAMILLWPVLLMAGTAGGGITLRGSRGTENPDPVQSSPAPKPDSQPQQGPPAGPGAGLSGYEGKIVRSIEIPGVPETDRAHILDLLPQKTGEPLDRTRVRDSIRALYGTGRFADIQAEVTPAEQGITLAFTTSANFFVGAVNVEGAPPRPTQNQIVNASKFQLGELYTHDKLERALENIRQLMQEGGFYRARVTAETVSHADTHQVDVLFHITRGEQAHVGEVMVTGSSGLTSAQVQKIAHLNRRGSHYGGACSWSVADGYARNSRSRIGRYHRFRLRSRNISLRAMP